MLSLCPSRGDDIAFSPPNPPPPPATTVEYLLDRGVVGGRGDVAPEPTPPPLVELGEETPSTTRFDTTVSVAPRMALLLLLLLLLVRAIRFRAVSRHDELMLLFDDGEDADVSLDGELGSTMFEILGVICVSTENADERPLLLFRPEARAGLARGVTSPPLTPSPTPCSPPPPPR